MTSWNRIRYSLYAPLYDAALSRLPFFMRGRRQSLAQARLRAGERVLLVAAGTGLDLELGPDVLPDGLSLLATDITPAMLARLERRAEERRRQGRSWTVETAVMDAGRLTVPDASVDCVVMHLALAVVPDPIAAIREAARVLRPDGRVAIFDKFLPDGATPSLARRGAAAVARLVATDLNRQLGPLMASAGLQVVSREDVAFGGTFVAVCAVRA